MKYARVAEWLACLTEDRWFETNPRTIVGIISHCPPSSKCVPGCNTGEIKATRRGTGHPTSLSRLPRISLISDWYSTTYGIVDKIYLYLLPLFMNCFRDDRRLWSFKKQVTLRGWDLHHSCNTFLRDTWG